MSFPFASTKITIEKSPAQETGKKKGKEKMITTYKTSNIHSIVFITSLLTLAATVCAQLEKAGRPAQLCLVNGRFAILVPREMADDTKQLLVGHERRGEIFIPQD